MGIKVWFLRLFLAFFIFSHEVCMAGIVDWVFINHVKDYSRVGRYVTDSYYNWSGVYINDEEETLQVVDFLRGRGVKVDESSKLGLQFYHSGNGSLFHGSAIEVNSRENVKDFLARAAQRYSAGNHRFDLQYGANVPAPISPMTCVFMGNIKIGGNNFLDIPESRRYSLTTESNQSQCAVAAPVDQWCAMNTSNITLDFGNVNSLNFMKKMEEVKVNVYCTSGVKFFIKNLVNNTDFIALSNGLEVKLTLDDKPLNQVQQSVQGDNIFFLKGYLQGNPKNTGPFSGSGILAIDYP